MTQRERPARDIQAVSKEIDRSRRHDLDNIDQGLVYLAMNYGKARRASRKMAEDGLEPIPPATLDYWKKVSHPGRYEQLRAEMEKRRDLNAAERMDALVSRALDIEADLLDKTAEKLDKIDARDLPNAFKNLAIGSGVLQDKSDGLKGKPAVLIEHRYDVAVLDRLIAEKKQQLAQALAEEEASIDAEVVEELQGKPDASTKASP